MLMLEDHEVAKTALHWVAAGNAWLLCVLYFARSGQMRGHIQRPAEALGRAGMGGLLAFIAVSFIARAAASSDFQWFHFLVLGAMIFANGCYLRLVLTPNIGRPLRVLDPEGFIMSTELPPPTTSIATIEVPASKWGKPFWADYAERVGSTLGYALITLLTTAGLTDLSYETLWPVLGLPVALSAIKGLLANARSDESGASLLPSDGPGPVLAEDRPHA